MEKPGVFGGRLSRLQWRLTLSYTLVTVAALIVVELALFLLLIIILNSGFLTREIVGVVEEDIVPRAIPFLESTPPDLDGLNSWLGTIVDDSVASDGQGRRITRGLSIEFDQDFRLFVIGADGRLLAQALEGHKPATLGGPFDAATIPMLAPLLEEALSGEIDMERTYTTTPDGTLLLALPIVGQDGRSLGAFVVTMALPAFNTRTLGSIALLVLISLIPFTLAAGLIGTLFGFLTARGLTRRIESLSFTANGWSRGDFSMMTADTSADELGQLSRRLNVMAEQLQNLLHSHQELAAIQERNRLARELHDSVKQQVFAATMQIGAAQAALPADPDSTRTHLTEAELLSRQAQDELTTLIQELRPAALEGDELAEKLEQYLADWSRQSGIQARFQLKGGRPLPEIIEQALFRLAQEALSNAARHSDATVVELALTVEAAVITFSLKDDGQGFDMTAARDGYGLKSMQERVENLGGRWQIESEPGRGAWIRAQIPVQVGDD
jgi:NarL family two-component system sensor histidine kinase LiaS